MNDNVVPFTGITRLPIDPEVILKEASKVKFTCVMIIGYTEDGEEYTSCSDPDGGMALWLMERTKYKLLRTVDAYE